jgi:hypothetical protein
MADDAKAPEAEEAAEEAPAAEEETTEEETAAFETKGDTTVTPAEYARWHKENAAVYATANALSVAGLVKRLAEEKRYVVTKDLKAETDDADAMVKRFASALVYGDVLLKLLVERYETVVKDDASETTKAFADAHAAWAGAIAANYITFFTTLGRRAKLLPPDAPLKVLYERMTKADLIPVF